MSTLTIALASIGGIVLAGVVAHGAWTARQAGPKRASPPSREDPGLTSSADPDGLVADRGSAADADADDAGATTASTTAARRLSLRAALKLDALIDAIAVLTLESPIGGDLAASHLPQARRTGSKLFLIEGLNTETSTWEAPVSGQRYGEFQAGVQLASRTGALNEIEYSEFVQRVQLYADAIGAQADVPDMLDVMARARELDGFAGKHDAQLAVHLHARAASWSVGYIQQHARRHGFVPGVVAGRLVYPSAEEGAPPVLSLTFDSQAALADDLDLAAVRDVTLAFDVPQTDASAEPFVVWQATAQALAVGMDAAIIDDGGQPLSPDGFVLIGGELENLYRTLESRDLAAGSTVARRLFS